MKSVLKALIPAGMLVFVSLFGTTTAQADDSVTIKLLKGPRYEADGYILGPKELQGYLGAIMEDDGVTEELLTGHDGGDDEGETLFAEAAKRTGLKALRKENGDTREL